MDYKITEFNAQTGQITICFIPLDYYVSIDLPINEDRMVPEGEELNIYIQGFLPYYLVKRKELLARGIVNSEAITNLI